MTRADIGATGADTTGTRVTGARTTGARTTGARTTGARTTGARTTGARTTDTRTTDTRTTDTRTTDTRGKDTVAHHAQVLVVGGGFSGIGLGHALLESRFTDFVILERAPDVGGVWQANTYPGCRCDVPSHLYSFSFAPNPDWSSTYSPRAEIHAYLRRCADRFGLRPHLRTGVGVEAARWDEDAQLWHVTTSEGPWTARVLVSAVGPLTEPKLPDVPGIDRFRGTIMHSARWDHDHDLTGERVASIGTGASAIQYVPEIADRTGRAVRLPAQCPVDHPARQPADHRRRAGTVPVPSRPGSGSSAPRRTPPRSCWCSASPSSRG
ncbi:hypothetical protein GCM10020295_19660 [Streptomyces cinereospinus]